MPDFSSVIPDTHRNVSSGFVEILIQTQREKLFTGLMHLHYPSGRNLVFSFLNGVQQKLYISREQNIEEVSRQFWSSYLNEPEASIGFLDLSIDALRIARVVYEAPVTTIQRTNYLAENLSDCVRDWRAQPFSSIVHIEGEATNRFYLISGFSTPVFEELLILDGQAQIAVNDVSFAKSLPPNQYQVTRYISDNTADIWQQYELRFAFNPLMRMMMARFSELAGRILAERLCNQLTASLRDTGLNISVSTNGMVSHHYFESLEDARNAYLKILWIFNELAGPAVGPRMARGLARDILPKLNPYHRSLLQRHVYDFYDINDAAIGAGRMQS